MSNLKKFSAYVDVPCEWVSATCPSNGEVERLQAENARLREMVAQMYPRAKTFLRLGVQLGCNDTLSYDWKLQMQELRIEVDA